MKVCPCRGNQELLLLVNQIYTCTVKFQYFEVKWAAAVVSNY